MNETQTVLLVDDNEGEHLFVRRACAAAKFGPSLKCVQDGEEAVAYLKGDGVYRDRQEYPLPVVMLLDLRMPRMNGFEVIEWVRKQPGLKRLAIIVLTTSAREDDVTRAYDLGATSYLVKPQTTPGLVAMICCLRDWLEYNHFPPLRAGS